MNDPKLALRQHFLSKLQATREPIRVLDCYRDDSLWRTLRSNVPVASYWAVNLKPKKGGVKIDPSRILTQPGWLQNVIDLDAYPSPWRHWLNLVWTCKHSVTVFLSLAEKKFTPALGDVLGMRFRKMEVPKSLGVKFADDVINHALAIAEDRGFAIGEIQEAHPQDEERMIGIELKKNL